MNLAVDIYTLTRDFPRDAAFGLTTRMRRAAGSIPANIADGFGRAQRRSFIQFLRIAQGWLKELKTHTILSERVGILDKEQAGGLALRHTKRGKMLVSLVRSLER